MPDYSQDISEVDLTELGRRLYQKALVRQSDEPIVDPKGRPIGWLLDTRVPMLEADLFQAVGKVMAGRLRQKGI